MCYREGIIVIVAKADIAEMDANILWWYVSCIGTTTVVFFVQYTDFNPSIPSECM